MHTAQHSSLKTSVYPAECRPAPHLSLFSCLRRSPR